MENVGLQKEKIDIKPKWFEEKGRGKRGIILSERELSMNNHEFKEWIEGVIKKEFNIDVEFNRTTLNSLRKRLLKSKSGEIIYYLRNIINKAID